MLSFLTVKTAVCPEIIYQTTSLGMNVWLNGHGFQKKQKKKQATYEKVAVFVSNAKHYQYDP